MEVTVTGMGYIGLVNGARLACERRDESALLQPK